MANVNLRGVEDEVAKRAKAAAVVAGVTLVQWVEDAMRGKLGLSPAIVSVVAQVEPKEVHAVKVAARVQVEVVKCRRCDGIVERDPRAPQYWKCETCKRQLDESEVRR